jgi:hypothetical protein
MLLLHATCHAHFNLFDLITLVVVVLVLEKVVVVSSSNILPNLTKDLQKMGDGGMTLSKEFCEM